MTERRNRARILGLGLDGRDGHVRITRGENFHLAGGSEETHEQMQESCIKLNEKLRSQARKLEDLGRDELKDLAAECDMNLVGEVSPSLRRE